MKIFEKLFNSRKRYVNLSYSQPRTFRKVNDIILKSLGREINLYQRKDLKNLTLEDLKKIDKNIKLKYQKDLIKLLKPEIEKITNGIFDPIDLSNMRVGVQCKFKKNKQNKESHRPKNVVHKMKDYLKPTGDLLLNYSTIPHQDLSNNGFRSSSVLIFYFQITPNFEDTCLME